MSQNFQIMEMVPSFYQFLNDWVSNFKICDNSLRLTTRWFRNVQFSLWV